MVGNTYYNIILSALQWVPLCYALAAYSSHPFHYRSGFDFCSQDLFNILTRSGTTRICQGIRFIQVPIVLKIYSRSNTLWLLSFIIFSILRLTKNINLRRDSYTPRWDFYSNHVVTVHYAFYFINTTIFGDGDQGVG